MTQEEFEECFNLPDEEFNKFFNEVESKPELQNKLKDCIKAALTIFKMSQSGKYEMTNWPFYAGKYLFGIDVKKLKTEE